MMAQSLCATKLEEMVQCAICFEPLDQPLTFKCFHSFCCKCTQGFQTEAVGGKQAYSCPECRQLTYTDQLQRTHLLTNLLELRQLFLNEQKPCSKCEKNTPTWRCLQCKSNCCDTCKKDHDFYPMLKDHHLILLSDADTSLSVDKVIYCDAHKDKMLELHCQPCDALICYLCKAVEHDGHPCKTVEHSLKETLPIIEKYRDVIASSKTAEVGVVSKIDRMMQENGDVHDKLRTSISKRQAEVEQQVMEEHAKLAEQVEASRSERRYELEKQKKAVESSIKEKQGILTWTENLLSTTQGVSLLTELRGNVKSQLETIAARKEVVPISGPSNFAFLPANSNVTQSMIGSLSHTGEINSSVEKVTTSAEAVTTRQSSNQKDEASLPEHKDTVAGSLSKHTAKLATAGTSLTQQKASSLHDIALGGQGQCKLVMHEHIKPMELQYRANNFAMNEDKIFVLEYGTNAMHTYDTQLQNVTKKKIALTGVKVSRGLVVVGKRLIIASNQGLFVCKLDGNQVVRITAETTSAVADYKNTVCALLPTGDMAVQYFVFDPQNNVLQATNNRYVLDGHSTAYDNCKKDIKEGCFSLQLTKHHIWVTSMRMRAVEQYDRYGGILGTIDGSPACPKQLSFPAVCDKDKHGNVLCMDRKHGLFMITPTGESDEFSSSKLTEIGMCFAKLMHSDQVYVLRDNAKSVFEVNFKHLPCTMKVFQLKLSANP